MNIIKVSSFFLISLFSLLQAYEPETQVDCKKLNIGDCQKNSQCRWSKPNRSCSLNYTVASTSPPSDRYGIKGGGVPTTQCGQRQEEACKSLFVCFWSAKNNHCYEKEKIDPTLFAEEVSTTKIDMNQFRGQYIIDGATISEDVREEYRASIRGSQRQPTPTKGGGTERQWSANLGKVSWEDASAMCESMGMRLPTIEELKTAYSAGVTKPWKSDGDWNWYWTSTPTQDNEDKALLLGIHDGGTYYNSIDHKDFARCIR